MTMEFSGADAEVGVSGADGGIAVSMTASKINISNCDQRYCTINGSGDVFSNNMRSG